MSTVVYGPPFVLDGPVPIAQPFRLLDVAQNADPNDVHWQNGIQLYPFPEDLPDATAPCDAGTSRVKGTGTSTDLPIFGPFEIYLAETCSSISVPNQEAYQRRAELALAATESYALEKQLVSGHYASTNPYLADANVSKPFANVAQGKIEGLAVLEDAIGQTAKGGVIHAPPSIVTAWDAVGAELVEKGGILYTRRGTPIIVGDGYIGAHPDSAGAPASHTEWAWATGPVLYIHGELVMLPANVKEALDRDNNVITYRAERSAVVAWDTQLQTAVLIDRTA